MNEFCPFEKMVLTAQEACLYLGLQKSAERGVEASRKALQRLRPRGLRPLKFSDENLYWRSELDRFLESQTEESD